VWGDPPSAVQERGSVAAPRRMPLFGFRKKYQLQVATSRFRSIIPAAAFPHPPTGPRFHPEAGIRADPSATPVGAHRKGTQPCP
jgi:hypothetical protein